MSEASFKTTRNIDQHAYGCIFSLYFVGVDPPLQLIPAGRIPKKTGFRPDCLGPARDDDFHRHFGNESLLCLIPHGAPR